VVSEAAPRVSVIIRCCNEEQHIGRLLSGILEQTLREVEIIVVDSGSTDATLAIASRYPVHIRHIAREDFSFGRSLNVGCAAARGEFLVMASAHVYPIYRDWLEKLIEPFKDTNVAVVYGQQRGDDRTKYAEQQIFEKLYPAGPAQLMQGYFCNNANAAVRRALWQELPYDEALTGLEDLAWARAVGQRGLRVAYQGEAGVIHVHDESWRQVLNRYRREAIALKRIAPEEHFGLSDFVRCFASNVLSDLRHAQRDARLRAVWPGVLQFRFMQFWGTYRGFATGAAIPDNLKQTFYYPKGWDHEADMSGTEQRAAMRIPYAALGDDDER
jgi:rhamnosyltransferase